MKKYEAVVIGAGPGGYEAALELAKAGVKTLLLDRNKERIGGTCLNEGCIPAKNYLESAEYFSKAAYFKEHGVNLEAKGLDIIRLQEKTRTLIKEIRSGVAWLLEQADVESIYGDVSFSDAHTIEVSGEKIGFDKCIIATGSRVRELASLPLDGKRIISSKEVFELKSMPKSIVIVGGGPIGCEFATFFNAFGVEVTLIGRRPQLVPAEDEDVAKALMREFKKRNIKVLAPAAAEKAVVKTDSVELLIKGKTEERIVCELVLLATGRIPNVEGLNQDKAGVELNEKGFIQVNDFFQTTQKHIYATGDCIQTFAFAHTAYAEARIAARNIAKDETAVNNHITPSVIFSRPQIGSCGLKENEAKEQGIEIEVKKAYFKANAKAKIKGDDSGFIKMVVCAKSGVILGASIIGTEATEIIHEIVLAVEKKIKAEELKSMIHAHPSVSEIISFL